MDELPALEVCVVFDGVDGPGPVAVVAGEVDVATSPELERRITALAESGVPRVVVDLQAVEFIDASGIGALMAAANAAAVVVADWSCGGRAGRFAVCSTFCRWTTAFRSREPSVTARA